MADYSLNLLGPQHAEALVQLDAHACSCAPEDVRSAAFLSAILNLHSKLAFGMWLEDQLVGAALGMAMGKLGALVHCCVAPHHQRQGIGTALVEAVTTNVLAHADVCVVQVPVGAQWELGWLTSCGFQCVEPQLILRKPVSEIYDSMEVTSSSPTTQWQDLLNMEHYGTAMEGAALGHLLRAGNPEACFGMIFIETAPRRQAVSHTAAVSFGSVRRSLSGDSLITTLRLSEALAYRARKRWLVVALNGIYHRELELLLKSGWTVAKTSHRMVHKKSLSRYRQLQSLPQVDMSHWSL